MYIYIYMYVYYDYIYIYIATDNQLERILENMNISRFLDVLSDYSSTF